MTALDDDDVISALLAEYDRAHGSGVWIMSPEWRDELRRIFHIIPSGLHETLHGLPVDVLDEASFPKLIPRRGVPDELAPYVDESMFVEVGGLEPPPDWGDIFGGPYIGEVTRVWGPIYEIRYLHGGMEEIPTHLVLGAGRAARRAARGAARRTRREQRRRWRIYGDR